MLHTMPEHVVSGGPERNRFAVSRRPGPMLHTMPEHVVPAGPGMRRFAFNAKAKADASHYAGTCRTSWSSNVLICV